MTACFVVRCRGKRALFSLSVFFWQSQYKSHFVAASLNNQKTGSSAAGASGWTSAGSLNSVPTSSAQQNAANSDSPIAAAAAAKGVPGFTSTGNLSSVPTFPSVGVQGFNNTNASTNSREGSGGSSNSVAAGGGGGSSGGGGSGGGGGGSVGGIVRERYDNRNSRHNEVPRRGEGGGRYNDMQRHGEGGGRHSDAYRHGEGRHGDSHRHGESRHFADVGSGNRNNGDSRNSNEGRNNESRNNESRNGENRKDANSRDNKTDGFAVPEPPKRKKSRWDS